VSRALVYFVSLLTLVMGAAAFAQEPLAAPRAGPAPQAVQGSSGPCRLSLTSGATGPIRFQADGCAEIAPAAIRRINEFLADFPRTRASLQKLLERPGLPPAGKVMLLEGWSTTYRELTNAVAAQGQSSRVAELLRQGDMDQAAVALDEALRNESLQALAEAARNHSHRAQVYELQFERARALFHYEMAYSYQASYQNGLDYATALHAAGQIGRAVSVYEDALGKLRSAAGNRSPEEQLALAVTLTNLASLYRDTQRTEDAVRIYEEALGVRRGLARSDPAAHRPILAMTLTNLAHLYHERQQPEQAGRTIQEALTISRQLWQENPQANGDLLAQALITAVRIAPTPNPSVECPLVEEALRVATSDAIKQVAQLYLQACSGTRN
jgi:tetratricopeptide (TPR) repeat protein